MNVLLVSQCSGRALKESRRILDQFAERRGERTWQTPITRTGIDTLRKLLRKGARRNTAVSCRWIRGHDHTELLWIVGSARRFNTVGAVPNNTTRNILRDGDENDWHTGGTWPARCPWSPRLGTRKPGAWRASCSRRIPKMRETGWPIRT